MKLALRLLALLTAACAICASACAAGALSRVSFEINTEMSFEEPLSRWLSEICDMAVINAGYFSGESGKYLQARLDMGKQKAFELKLIRGAGNVYIDGDLLDKPVVIRGICDWADDMLAYAAFSLKTPSSGSATVLSNEALALALKSFAGKLRSLAATARGAICWECENCQACENCQRCDMSTALAMFVQALAERLDGADEHNALIINCQRLKGEMRPFVIEAETEAGDGLTVEMTQQAIKATTSAIAGNTPPPSPP